MGRRLAVYALVAGVVLAPARGSRAGDDGTAEARSHYEMGIKLFDAREHEQALIEFSRANELKSRPAALFMMAQCEYLLGRLKDARAHYQTYVTENPDGEFAALARDRVESIDKRRGTFAINTVPDDVTIRISPEGQTGVVVASGQAPNNFSVPRGRYRIDVTKPNYQGQTRLVDVDLAETKPLFFKLEPIPARLEIETRPASATLYVNGNRARNPYRQDVIPGHVEIFAEAPDYDPRTTDVTLLPGQKLMLTGDNPLRLSYRQRSGRPELLAASAVIGGLFGAGAVVAIIGGDVQKPNVSSVLLATGGAIAGGILGSLVATPLVPAYIPDNRALFIIGGMWVGLAEGALGGIVGQQIVTSRAPPQLPCTKEPCRGPIGDQLRSGFIGSVPGLALGLTGGALLRNRAPTYGRVALIQSAALGGAVLGAVAQYTSGWQPYGSGWGHTVVRYDPSTTRPAGCEAPMGSPAGSCAITESSVLDLMPGALIGLNVGLAAGLFGAYLPDQSRYGPTWKHVLLVDLAVGAGAVAGATFGCVANPNCLSGTQTEDRQIAAGAALGGAALGLIGGILLTRHIDDDRPDTAPGKVVDTSSMPIATFAPMRDLTGALAPAFAAMGRF